MDTLDHTPWYQSQLLAALVGAILPIVVAIFTAYRRAVQERKVSNSLKEAQVKIGELKKVSGKYEDVKAKLQASTVIVDYEQPVLLLGPTAVGKSSLMRQWDSPWSRAPIDPSRTRKASPVPVYDFPEPKGRPHFACQEVTTPVQAHLKLLVHDFPGALRAQKSIIQKAKEETERLQREINARPEVKQDLGVVLICMFSAEEMGTEIGEETRRYYNGELFGTLRDLNAKHSIKIERLIIVFNKFDLLRDKMPGMPDRDLLSRCSEKLYNSFGNILEVCNTERMCETIAVLNLDNTEALQGATFIRGEAARALVSAVVGQDAARGQFGPEPEPPHGGKPHLP